MERTQLLCSFYELAVAFDNLPEDDLLLDFLTSQFVTYCDHEARRRISARLGAKMLDLPDTARERLGRTWAEISHTPIKMSICFWHRHEPNDVEKRLCDQALERLFQAFERRCCEFFHASDIWRDGGSALYMVPDGTICEQRTGSPFADKPCTRM
jgi:hypothetical protein